MEIVLDEKGLVPAIVQDARTGEVLMHGFMDQEALRKTLQTGQAWFYSRSRQELWHKGATSGNYVNIKAIEIDCDGDTLLLKCEPTGPVCHTGKPGCFFQTLDSRDVTFDQKGRGVGIIPELFQVIEVRKRTMPQDSYVANLMREGTQRIVKKVMEEAGETTIAALQHDKKQLIGEGADLWFHTLVLLSAEGLTPDDIWTELQERRK